MHYMCECVCCYYFANPSTVSLHQMSLPRKKHDVHYATRDFYSSKTLFKKRDIMTDTQTNKVFQTTKRKTSRMACSKKRMKAAAEVGCC
jgi:hypothetical protein